MTPISPFRRVLFFVPIVLSVIGCGSQAAPLHPLEAPPTAPPVLGTKYDLAATGTIHGRVIWSGDFPKPRAQSRDSIVVGDSTLATDQGNELFPRISPGDHGVGEAVVFLRHVDFAQARPWDLPAARVTTGNGSIRIEQGGAESHLTGFVYQGDSIEMISTRQGLEMLRASGAAFFTLAFPESGKVLSRTLTKPGLVEWSSATTFCKARAWTFVAEHPYYVRTDSEGRFALDRVPNGIYELVCWMPNWKVDRFERDPEVQYISRLWYLPPLEKSMAVKVGKEEITKVEFRVSEDEFQKKGQ